MAIKNANAVELLCAGLVQLLWGAHPVAGRWLQNASPRPLPSFALLVVTNLFALSLLVLGLAVSGKLRVVLAGLRAAPTALVALYTVVVAGRSSTNIVSTRFVDARHVQLMQLFTPFFVAIAGRLFVARGDAAPALGALHFLLMAVATVGGALSLFEQGDLLGDNTRLFGLLLSFISSLLLSAYFLVSRRVMASARSKGVEISGFAMVFLQFTGTLMVSLCGTVIMREDWAPVLGIASRWKDVVALIVLILPVTVGLNTTQLVLISRIGPAVTSAPLALRLVGTVAGGWMFLEETASVVNWVGLTIVLVSVTAFLVWRVMSEKRRALQAAEPAIELEKARPPSTAYALLEEEDMDD